MYGLRDINLDKFWSYFNLMEGSKGTRASYGPLSNAFSTSNKASTYTLGAGKATGG